MEVPGVDVEKEHSRYDEKKISSFQECPRKFFFRYVLGWSSETPDIRDAFDSAWRKALTFLHTSGDTDSRIREAISIFEEAFQKGFPLILRDKHPVKNAEIAREGLREYANCFPVLDEFEILSTDIAGTVSIRDDRAIYFGCDHISRNREGQIWGISHKTTSDGGSSWKEKWGLDFQTNVQSYALSRLYEGEEEVAGMKINGAIFPPDGKNEFIRIPSRRSPDQLQLWRQECNYWIDLIEKNWELLAETSRSDDVMHAFPRSPSSCGQSGCRFKDMCENWCNPLQHSSEPPVGYEEDHYDPQEKESEANQVVSL